MLFRILILLFLSVSVQAQTHPIITSWLIKDSANPTLSIKNIFFSQNWVYLERNEILNHKKSYFTFPIQPDTSKLHQFVSKKQTYKAILINGNVVSKNKPLKFKKINQNIGAINGLILSLDSTRHSSIIGFANDGFPIYGPFGYYNKDGTGKIVRLKSGYHSFLKVRIKEYAKDVSFENKYQFKHSESPDYLDEYNGRFCVTPEYPQGNYCYFLTLNSKNKLDYPFMIGSKLFGNSKASIIDTIDEPFIKYAHQKNKSNLGSEDKRNMISVFYADKSELIVIQCNGLINEDIKLQLFDSSGNKINETILYQGSTIAYFDAQALYDGDYIVKTIVSSGITESKIMIHKK